MDWQSRLVDGETLRWCGRPAPRCFTFRHWIHSLFGLLLLPLAWVWLDGGRAMADATGQQLWGVIPWFGVVLALYFLCGHLVRARLAWEKTFYAISDRRVMTVGGWPICHHQEIQLAELRYVKLIPRGEQLGSVLIYGCEKGSRAVLACLEYPHKAITLLEEALQAKQNLPGEIQ